MFDLKEYTSEIENLFLQFLISDSETFARCRNIIDPEYFSGHYKDCVSFLLDYSDKYSAVPSERQIYATTKVRLQKLDEINEDHEKWFLHEFELFCRHKALINAVLEAADLIEKKDYGVIETKIKEAIGVGLVKDLGTDYFEDPKFRLLRMKDKSGMVSTGWAEIDRKLFGGFNRGEINIFCGPSGAGKSLFLQNIALNLSFSQLNVVYITLELSEDLCSYRLDSMITKYPTREIFKNLDDVDLKVRMYGKKTAGIRIKQMVSGVTVNDIKTYLKELEIQTGKKVDALIVDYLDLMMPASRRVDPSNLFVKDKFVTEELRNLAVEKNLVLVSAAQLNRCLSLDTKVSVGSKEVKIKDVQVGDLIDSNKGPVKVLEKIPITTQRVYKIKTKSGKEIICSADHKFPTSDGNLKSINSGLKVGNTLKIKGRESEYRKDPNEVIEKCLAFLK